MKKFENDRLHELMLKDGNFRITGDGYYYDFNSKRYSDNSKIAMYLMRELKIDCAPLSWCWMAGFVIGKPARADTPEEAIINCALKIMEQS